MEHLEIVHAHNGELVGEVLPRHEALAKQAWCRSTNVFIINSKGQILCHQRTENKERYPGYWVTHVGGHVGVGETYEINAWKELKEEAGIHDVEPHQLIAWRTAPIHVSRLWARDFVVLIDKEAHEFTPQQGEVQHFAWKTPHEILESAQKDGNWLAGMQDFWTEYHCLRAVLAAAQMHNVTPLPDRTHVWEHQTKPEWS